MRGALIFGFITLLCVNAVAQSGSQYLFRQHVNKDSTWTVDNTECYFVRDAGMSEKHFGWFRHEEIAPKNSDLLIFEANTLGSVQLVLELDKGVTKLNAESLSPNSFQLINNFYGYLRRDIAKKDKTVDHIKGELTFQRTDDTEIVIDGKLKIDTENPTTHQEIIFDKCKLSVNTTADIVRIKEGEELEKKRREKLEWGVMEIALKERRHFFDSVFNLKKYPGNNIRATLNKKTKFDFTLDNSYILLDAQLTQEVKNDLMELLGSNILVSVEGNKKVFVLHSFYDPEENSIDDETNYSLSVEMENISPGKVYDCEHEASGCKATLSFWHYGPGGTVILSKEVKGTIAILEDDNGVTSGKIDLKFSNTDKSAVTLSGGFQLPKLRLSSIAKMESRILEKQRAYLSTQK